MNHKYSTIALIFIIAIVSVVLIASAVWDVDGNTAFIDEPGVDRTNVTITKIGNQVVQEVTYNETTNQLIITYKT